MCDCKKPEAANDDDAFGWMMSQVNEAGVVLEDQGTVNLMLIIRMAVDKFGAEEAIEGLTGLMCIDDEIRQEDDAMDEKAEATVS